MKKILLTVIVVGVIALLLYRLSGNDVASNTAQYRDEALGYTFEYPSGEEGYILLEQAPNESNPDLIKTLVLMHPEDYQSIQSGERDGGEGPPVINIHVYRNPLGHTVEKWIEANSQISNYPLIMGEMMNTTMGGRTATKYDADGLYPNRNVVLADGDLIYLANGSYLDKNSSLYRDFSPILNSFKFDN